MDILDDDSFFCIVKDVCAMKKTDIENALCVCIRMRKGIIELLTRHHMRQSLCFFKNLQKSEFLFKDYIKKKGLLVTNTGIILMQPRPRRRCRSTKSYINMTRVG